MLNDIICGDCTEIMKMIESNYIDLTITSPPYDNIRNYNGYINFFKFNDIADELYRITKSGGVVVWIVGDSTINGSESGTSFRQALYFKDIGFKLHDTMIYMKNNFSNPSRNRYHQIFEYMFILSKGSPKTFNPIKDRKNIYAGSVCWGKNTYRNVNGEFLERDKKVYSEYGMRYNVWKYITSKIGQNNKISYNHPASFPEQLVIDHILSWSNTGDIIFDPMCGSGTTLSMAKNMDRNFIGIDVNPIYCEISRNRCGLI